MASRFAPASLVLLVSVFLLSGPLGHAVPAAQQVATIASDLTEYTPGDTVTLTGGGWTPQETVTIVVHRNPFLHPDEVLTSVADASGTITNTSFALALDGFGVTFLVTAIGSQSGLQATTTFDTRAADHTWSGITSTDWNTATNWSPAGIPLNTDDVEIPATVVSGRYPVVSSVAAAKSVTMTTGVGTPSLTISGTLTVAGNFNIANINATVTLLAGGTISVTAGNITIAGTLSIPGGTFITSRDVVVSSAGRVNVSGGTLHLASTSAAVPTNLLQIVSGGTVTQSGGSIDVRDFETRASLGRFNQSGGTLKIYRRFINAGIYEATTGGTLMFAQTGDGDAFKAAGKNQFFNVVVNPGVDTNFSSDLDAQIFVAGNWTMDGTANLTGKTTKVTFNGSGAQTIGGAQPTTFCNLEVDKTPGTAVTLLRNATIAPDGNAGGIVKVVRGTLDLATFTLNRSVAGGEIGVVNDAFLKIGGTNTFPSNYATHSFQPTSTVDYYGTNQTVTAELYGHLNLSTSGTKTMPATALTTQSDFTMSGTASATAAAALTVNKNFTLGPGTTFGAASFSHIVRGNFSNSGTFTGGTSAFTFNGTSTQTIGGSNSTTFNNLTINNPGGVVLNGVNTTVNGILTFTSGIVATGPSQFIATSSTGSTVRTSGHVAGNFRKNVATGATVRTYEVGDSANDGAAYTPVTVAFGSVSVAGDLTCSTTRGDHPNAGTSPVARPRSVNRYWTCTNSGVGFTNYNATFNFVGGDLDAGINTNAFIVGKFGGAWTAPTVGTKTGTSTQITGVTSFSDFYVGESAFITTLGTGVDPASTIVAPGGAATTADAFTFQTDGGTDTVTAVTVTLAPGTFASLLQLQITDDAESTVYGSVNPLSDTPSIQLTTPITATTTSTQYKLRVKPESHALMPSPPGSSYALTARVSSWTGSNFNHAGSDSGGTTVTIDNSSPANVTVSTATSGNSQVTLAWTNPLTSDLGTILVLRRTGSAVGDTPTEGTTYSVGNTIGSSIVACVVAAPGTGCTDSGVTNGTVYHYRIFANDTNGNYALGVVPAGSPVTPNLTTLGNGTDPANATIAPGGAATMADAFTFQTGSGTDAITAVTVRLAAGTSAGVSLVEITNDAGSIAHGSVSDPSSDTVAIPLTTPITATTTSTQYKIRVTPKSHLAMPVPPGASYALTASVSSWTGTNSQGGSDSGGTTITIDNLSPGNVTGVTATSGDQQITVAWTNPADSDLQQVVVLRRAGAAVASTPTEGVNYFLGDTIGSSTVACVVTAPATSCTDAGLDNGTAYHYKLFARDTNRNYATGVVPTGSPVTPTVTTIGDGTPVSSATIAPGGAATMADAFAFQTASGADAITSITLALAAGTSAGVSLVEITNSGGTIVYGSVSNPPSDVFTVPLSINIIATQTIAEYRIRVTPKSHAAMPAPPGTSYALTAHITDWTGTNAHDGGDSGNTTITIDNRSPGNVTNATATAGSTQVLLAWTNPADSDLGTIVVLRRAGAAVTDTPVEGVTYSVGNSVGSSTVACVTAAALGCADVGLINGTDYHYTIFSKDIDGNYATGVVPAGSPATPFSRITVTPTSGLTTTEAGGTATFIVVLISRPVADVTIGLSSSDTTEGTVNRSSLTFTSANWDIPQTVTVTGVDDTVDDGDITYSIVTAPATSAGGYNGVDANDVSVTNTNNDTAGIKVQPTGLSTTEAGGTATFTVVLNTQPTADVTIDLSSSDTTEGTVSPASVTFTSANWNLPQVVTVTGVNDALADGNIPYTIVTAPAASSDGKYNGIDPIDVAVTNIDNNTVGIIVNPSSGLTTTEAGGTAAFNVVLNSQPTADVTIALSSSDATEGTINPASLTFTNTNWNAPQTVTVTGVNDDLDDGDVAYTIVTAAATSSDGNYNGLNPSDASVTNIDNETSVITVTPTSGLTTTEAGGSATFTIVLTSQPTADVTIDLSSSNTAEGTVTPASVILTPADWNVPQTVTVTGVDDPQVDGNITYTIVTAPATSTDPNYSGRNVSDVSVTNLDNDTAGITVTPTSGLTTSEAGGTATFTVVLTSRPAADVTIDLISNDVTEGTVSPASVIFTAANWNVAQTVTITGVNNPVDDGDITYLIVTAPATSTDRDYSRLNASDVSVTNIDDDTAGIVVTPTSGLITSEIGGEAPTFTVVLTSQPTANVVINLSSSDTTEGTVSPLSLTFTSANWNTPQTATVHGVNDVVDDGDIGYRIVTVATSGDPKYAAINPDDVTVTNIDSDAAGFFVNPISGLTTTEAGGRAHFTVVLNTQPLADVIIALSSSDPSEATVSPASLTFTSDNWNTPQTADVTGIDDALDDGDITFTIVTAAATSADPGYNGLNPLDVSVINIDNDTAGITVSPTFGLTTTESGGTATFTVVLNSQPTANVTIGLSSNDTSEGTVNPASVTFTTANWNTPQTVTVTGVDDLFDDGDVAYSIVTAPATSSDGTYNALKALDVSVSNTDDDTAGFTLTPTSGLITTEAGGTATFTMVLTARPTANVTIGLISSDITEGTVNQANVTFTSDNWNTAQTVTITGVHDALDDGDIAYDIVTTPASSSDSSYNGLSTGNVSVTNTDNDEAGITVTPTSGLITTEAGGTATFTIVLTSQPTADVTIGLSSNDTTEGTVSPSSLTFTTGNWNIARIVTVTGVDDVVDDGDIPFGISTAAATSGDPNYDLFDAANVLVTNTDNDVTGFAVTPTSGLTTTEAGGTATYTVALTSQPSADVRIAVSSSNTAEGTVAPASLTFTSVNWNVPQTVTVTGINDALDDGDIAYSSMNAPATSADATYNGVDPLDVAVINADGDTAGIIVTPTSGRITTEGLGTTNFAVRLLTQPTADVTIGLSSDDTTEGTVSPSSLTFTAVNWNTAQIVTVTGVDDFLDDGDIAYNIVTAAAISSDVSYSALDPRDVPVTNTDDDTSGITVTPTSGLTTTEAGGTATFTVVLTTLPTADVTITLSSSNTAEGTVSPASLVFTSVNGRVAQTVTVTGVNDALDDGDITYSIVTTASSADVLYAITVADVAVTNTDDDGAGVTVSPTSGLITTEAGGTATFTVTLTSQPTADVSIALSSDDVTEGAVSPASVTFTSTNWNTAQTVTITGVDDFLVDADIGYNIVTAAATSADSAYAGLAVSDVAVTNTDDDSAGVTVSPTSGLKTTEAGGTATFTVVLKSRPTADVTIGLSSGDTTEGTVSPATITFTSGNWNVAQAATVTGVDDALDDGDIVYSIVTAPATSADVTYAGLNASDVAVTNTDNDSVGGVSEVLTGTYVGNGADNRPITGLGFTPGLVIVKATTTGQAVARTATMTGDVSKQMGDGTLLNDSIQSMDPSGFTVGTSALVNATGTTYQWVAWRTGPDEMTAGTYTGTGASQSIAGLNFSPDIVFVLGDNGDEPVYKVGVVTPATVAFSFTGGDSTNYITALGSDGFTVGTDTRVNRSGDLYHYLAWNETAGKIGVGTYTGTGADNRNITNVGFPPDFVMVQNGRGGNTPPVAHSSAMGPSTDTSHFFGGLANRADEIQALQSDGFQVGTALEVNGASDAYVYAAWARPVATAVRMAAMSARRTANGVVLEWRTGYEADNLGYHVYRGPENARVRLTTSLLAGSGLQQSSGVKTGASPSYRWSDETDGARAPDVEYWVEEITLSGERIWHGPVRPEMSVENGGAAAGGAAPPGGTAPPASAAPPSPGLVELTAAAAAAPPTGGSPPQQETTGRAVSPAQRTPVPVRSLSRSGVALLASDDALQAQWSIAAQAAVKIDIASRGWYRLTQPALVAAGLPVSVDPSLLQLFVDGVEQPLRVNGAANGRFGRRDSVEFYATGADTPYTGIRTYWIVAGASAGQRIPVVDGRTGPFVGPSSFPSSFELKPRSIFFGALLNGDKENFFGPLVMPGEPTSQTIDLPDVIAPAPADAELEVALQGVTEIDHRVGVRVNGIDVGEVTFTGRDTGVGTFAVSQALLVDGANTVSLDARGGEIDHTLVDYIRVTYHRRYRARANTLTFTADAGQQITVGGFTDPGIRVIDITGDVASHEVRGRVSRAGAEWKVSFAVPGTGPRTLLAVATGANATPVALRANVPSTLNQAGQAGDIIMIAPAAFQAALAPLKAFREGQGYTVRLVDIEDVYDEFSFGGKTPYAIRDFVARATAQWSTPPRFLLLVGNATQDPRDYFGFGEPDYVPTKVVETGAIEAASDDWFVDADDDGYADLAITGRLPARTDAQVAAMVSKIIGYEQSAGGDWQRSAFLVSDLDLTGDVDFAALSDRLGEALPDNYQVTRIRRGIDPDAGAAVKARLSEGAALVSYLGHGSVASWELDLLTADDVPRLTNGGKLPIVIALACLNGLFQGLFPEESLAEALVRAPNGGAVGVWASSGVTSPQWQWRMNVELYRQIFQGGWLTIGEAMRAAKQVVGDPDVRRTWIYFGDPVTRFAGSPGASAGSITGAFTTQTPQGLVAVASPGRGDATDAEQGAGLAAPSPRAAVRLADLDADGQDDPLLVDAQSGSWFGARTRGDFPRAPSGRPVVGEPIAVDLNGDGGSDLFVYDAGSGEWLEAMNLTDGRFITYTGSWAPGYRISAGDFDGDGRDEIFGLSGKTGAWFQALPDGRGGFTYRSGSGLHDGDVRVADFDADSRDDVFVYDGSTGRWTLMLNNAGGPTVERGTWAAGWDVTVAYLNADRKADLFAWDGATGVWAACVRDAASFVCASGRLPAGGRIHPLDRNGDGRDELLRYDADTGSWTLIEVSPSGRMNQSEGVWEPGWSVATGDLDGDGRDDVALYNSETGQLIKRLSRGSKWKDEGSEAWPGGWLIVGRRP